MYTKLKLAIEAWLRGLIADEVSHLDHDLSNERASLVAIISVCDAQINEAVDRLSELSHFKENAELRAHIRDLESQFVGVRDTIMKIHPGKF